MSAVAVPARPRPFEGWLPFLALGAVVGATLLVIQSLYPPTDEEIFDAIRREPFSQNLPGLEFGDANVQPRGHDGAGFVQLSFRPSAPAVTDRRAVLISYSVMESAADAQASVDAVRDMVRVDRGPWRRTVALQVPVAHLGDDGFCTRDIVDHCEVRIGSVLVHVDSEYRFLGLSEDHGLEELTRAAVAHLRSLL